MPKIHSILKRSGGTHVDLPHPETGKAVAYHFAPNEIGDHVCDVEIREHVSRFLSIPEGYELYMSHDADLQPVDPDPAPPVTETPTPPAPEPVVPPEPNPTPPEPTPATETKSDADIVADAVEALKFDDLTDAQARAALSFMRGEKVHHNTKMETVREALKEFAEGYVPPETNE